MKRRGSFSIIVAVLLVVTLLLFLVAFQVRVNQSAIVFTFGRVARVIAEPGLYWKWPYPIQTVARYDRRLHVLEGKFQEYYTRDQHNVIVALGIGWSIEAPRQFEETLGSARAAEGKLLGLIGGEAQDVINRHDLAQFISTDREQLQFDNIEAMIHEQAREKALAQFGIDIPYVNLTLLGLPEEVTKNVNERIKAERSAKAGDYIAQGNSEAESIRSKADADASEILNEARARAIKVRGEGDREAAKHYAVFKKHPKLAVFLRELQAIERLRKRATYILTTASPPYRLLSPDLVVPGTAPPTPPAPAPERAPGDAGN